MSYQQTNIIQFAGYNSTLAPELIKDEEARQILNFRQEQIGKLVSRNGYVYGLFATPHYDDDPYWLENGDAAQNNAYKVNYGIVGIGELALESKWHDLDTDRFMVYAIRRGDTTPTDEDLATINATPENIARNLVAYFFAPLTGKYKNTLLTSRSINATDLSNKGRTSFDQRTNTIHSDEGVTTLVAPKKVVFTNNPAEVIDEWIDQYVDIKQYRHLGIISDRINGDMQIIDNFAEQREIPVTSRTHALELRPNTLDLFDIDIVALNPKLAANEENDASAGVETPMALYKFVLPKKTAKVSRDNFSGKISDLSFFGNHTAAEINKRENYQIRESAAQKLADYFLSNESNTLLTMYHWIPGYRLPYPSGNNRTITNTSDPYMALWTIPPYAIKDPNGKYLWTRGADDNFTTCAVPGDDYDNGNGKTWIAAGTGENTSTGDKGFIKPNGEPGWEYLKPMYRFLPVLSQKDLGYTFTNAETPYEFRDLFGEVKLEEEDISKGGALNNESDGVYQNKEIAVNVAYWKDVKLVYHPTVGLEQSIDNVNNGSVGILDYASFCLKDADRLFTKLSAGIPKVKKLKVKDKYGRLAILSVYRYKFVWDYGDGKYSAPSSELTCPDIMWSATKDEDINSLVNHSSNTVVYKRPAQLLEADEAKAVLTYPNKDVNTSTTETVTVTPKLSNLPLVLDATNPNAVILSNVGEKFFKVKQALYDTSHKYGSQFTTTTELLALRYDTNYNDELLKLQQFGVLTTVDFGKTRIELKGNAWESCAIVGRERNEVGQARLGMQQILRLEGFEIGGGITLDSSDFEYGDGSVSGTSYTAESVGDSRLRFTTESAYPYWYSGQDTWFAQGFGKIEVPVFQSASVGMTENSLFDDEGRYRLSLMGGIKRQFILPGHNYGIGRTGESSFYPYNFVTYKDEVRKQLTYFLRFHPDYCYSDLALFTVNGRTQSNIVYNVVPEDYDLNNKTADVYNDQRVPTLFRAIKDNADSLLNVKANVPNQIQDRILVNGIAELELAKEGDDIYWDSEYTDYNYKFAKSANVEFPTYTIYEKRFENGEYKYNITRPIGNITQYYDRMFNAASWNIHRSYNYPKAKTTFQNWTELQLNQYISDNAATARSMNYKFMDSFDREGEHTKNVTISVYGQGTRLLALEQLTAMFPSSILFQSPRMGIEIPNDKIPAKAKKLLIFRTKASHSNDYDPNQYGLVDSVEINKSNQIVLTKLQNGQDYHGLYYFDKKKDTELDFGEDVFRFEGLTKTLRSRFNISLNEVTYYANFRMNNATQVPRTYGANSNWLDLTHIKNANGYLVSTFGADIGKGFPAGQSWRYAYVYEDLAGNASLPILSEVFNNYQVENPPLVNNVNTFGDKYCILSLMPSGYNNSIKSVKIYRSVTKTISSDEFLLDDTHDYRYIGSIKGEDEGIFVDTNLTRHGKLGTYKDIWENYESGLMYSEPYRPDWIKAESFKEILSGDGKQITGLQSIYGSLIVFKETSMHRLQVQGNEIPISRVDEIDKEIGCIAPHSLINVNNTLYFLSWKGFMMYNNNQLQKVDGQFAEDLRLLLAKLPEYCIRDISAGYNPSYNEIYLNIPFLDKTSADSSAKYDYASATNVYGYDKSLLGHIFVINPDKGYVTKFSYTNSGNDYAGAAMLNVNNFFFKKINKPNEILRRYYTNSLGEMRSADILPAEYGASVYGDQENAGFKHAGIYIETPYGDFKDEDDTWDTRAIALRAGITNMPTALTSWDFNAFPSFPLVKSLPFKSIFKSKFFTGNSESLIKRVRKFVLNVFSKGLIDIKTLNVTHDITDSRIDEPGYTDHYIYQPTVDSVDYLTSTTYTGTGSNVLSIVPNSGSEDTGVKPVKASVEIEGNGRTQINQLSFYWRPINSYLK